jgi:DNA-binding NarL/FixJ family response regulator
MNEVIKILLVEDNLGDAGLIQESLAEKAALFEITHVDRLSEAIKLLEGNNFDLVLLDLSLPDSSGIDTFRKVQLKIPNLPIILLTGLDDEVLALKLIKEGAQDYLVKGQINSKVLIKSICYAFERHNKNSEKAQRKDEIVKSEETEHAVSEIEKSILTLIAEGMSNEKIAEKLHLSLSTIRSHMGVVITKLYVSN